MAEQGDQNAANFLQDVAAQIAVVIGNLLSTATSDEALNFLSNIYWVRISQLNYNVLQLSQRAPVYTLDNWFYF